MSVAFPKLSDHKIGQNFKDSLEVPIEHPNKRIYQKTALAKFLGSAGLARFTMLLKILGTCPNRYLGT